MKAADADLQSKIDAATEAAEKAALEAQQNAVKEAAAQLETVKGELTAMISEQKEATDESIEAINTEIAKIQGSVQALEKLNGEIESLKTVDAALQTSISGLEAEVAENARKIGELQTTLEAQEDALELFKAATGENVEALQGDIAELQAKVAELAGSEDLRLVSEQLATLQDDFEALSDKVDAISADLNLLKNAWYTGVTSVSLVVTNEFGKVTPMMNPWGINLISAKSLTTTTFGEGLTGAVDFVKGQRTTQRQSVLVRVSPVTATLDPNSIKFINSKGEESLEGLVKVASVKPYDKLLTVNTTRATSASGLWEVVLEVADDVDDEFETQFDKATKVESSTIDGNGTQTDASETTMNPILFAMKVVDSDQNRGVVSEYNLTFGEEEGDAKGKINFSIFVGSNRYHITKLSNRFSVSETGLSTPTEWGWMKNNENEYVPCTEIIKEGGLKNVSEDVDDNRQDDLNTPVVESKEGSFKVSMKESDAAYYYITLDKERALSSDDSEILAWNLYESSISGINEVYSVKEKPEVEIGFSQDINDVLGFRVYAINANGTLQDPDGRAFYVRVGKVANVASATTSIIPDENRTTKSLEVPFEQLAQFADNKTEIASSDVVCDKVYNENDTEVIENIFDFKFALEGAKEGEYVQLSDFTSKKVEDLAKIKSVYVTKETTAGWNCFTDGKTYKNTISFKNDKDVVIATLEVNVTKTMPTSLPEGFGWKETQLTGDTYNCYVLANLWTAGEATLATMAVDNVFNVDNEVSDPDQYLFTFRTNDPKNDKKVEGYEDRNITLEESNFDMIDCKTEYAAVIEYNYGAISSKTNQDIKVSNLTAADPKEYKLIYHNLFAEDHYTIDWATNEQLAADGIYQVKRYVKTPIADQAAKVVFGKEFKAFEAYEDEVDSNKRSLLLKKVLKR